MSDIDNTNTIIIVVSIDKVPETIFLKKCGLNNEDWDNWDYALTDGVSYTYNVIIENFSFALINQTKWGNNVNIDHIIREIDKVDKNKIIWTHETEGITSNQIKSKITNRVMFCEKYNHPNIPCTFMKNISSGGTYIAAFKTSIDDAFKKKKHMSHLIAFYSLCQGYLAAHGGRGLESWTEIKNIKYKEISEERKELTESVEKWWRAIKESSSIEQEMKDLGLIIKFIEHLRGRSGAPLNKVTEISLVEEAYKELSKTENLGRFL